MRDELILAVTALSEEEFMKGVIGNYPNVCVDIDAIIAAYDFDRKTWNTLPEWELLEPKADYVLRYDRRATERLVFAVWKHGDGQLHVVGVFCDDTIAVHTEHQRQKLGRELVLAGYVQRPWGDDSLVCVTQLGRKTFLSAYQHAKKWAQ